MKDFFKSLTKKSWIKFALALVYAAFVVVVIVRKSIFPEESFFYHVYDEDMAGEVTVRLFKTLVILIAGLFAMSVGNFITAVSNAMPTKKSSTAKTFMLLIGNVIKYVAAIAILLVALSAWGVDTAAIVTGAGVLTLVIGLGCQSLVADIVAGIFMLFEGDIKVGDIVVIDGWRGTVNQIGLRRTKIEDAVGNINIVNNSSISNIVNNTRDLSCALIEVGIEYNESIERVESILKDNLAKMKEDIPAIVEGPYYLGVSCLNSSSVDIKFLAKCAEEDKYQVERDMNRAIKILFDKNNINIPFPQIVLNKREEDDVASKISKKELDEVKKFLEKQKEATRGLEDTNN